jgi:predicted aldo/keto reductase-like oxidoreductase
LLQSSIGDDGVQYRKDKHGNELSALGFGCMRFPRDKSETERMILTAIEGGVNFFDTAYLYPGSEVTLGEVLAKHNKRKDIYIATKLPIGMCKKTEDFDKYFDEQLKRLQTDYIDYYFLHNVPDFDMWDKMRKLGIEDWITKKKESGQIRQIGFSFHGTSVEFLKMLDSYDWEFTMIQYNYNDENYQVGREGLQAAAAKGMATIIMEPLLGGALVAGLPEQAKEVFKKANSDLTLVDWAFWWLWNQPEVTVVLTGMKSEEQVKSNTESAINFRPLSDAEAAVYAEVIEQFRKAYKINCTSCNYCLPCPEGINIPACFSAYNKSYLNGYITGAANYITSTALNTKNHKSVRNCNGCGKCEKICPQNLPIREDFKRVAGRLEHLPIRLVFSLVRRIMS